MVIYCNGIYKHTFRTVIEMDAETKPFRIEKFFALCACKLLANCPVGGISHSDLCNVGPPRPLPAPWW